MPAHRAAAELDPRAAARAPAQPVGPVAGLQERGGALGRVRRVAGVGQRRLGHQGIAEGEVEVHGAGAVGAFGCAPGPARQRPPVGRHARNPIGGAHLGEHPYRGTEQTDLVDGLVGAGAAQLRRTVGGEHQQRNTALVGFQHRGVEVGRGGPRRAHQGGRAALDAGQARREVGSRPLVDADVHPDVRVAGQGQRQGRGARPRRDDGLGQPAPGQFVDEDARQSGRRVHAVSLSSSGVSICRPSAAPAPLGVPPPLPPPRRREPPFGARVPPAPGGTGRSARGLRPRTATDRGAGSVPAGGRIPRV